MHEVGLCEGIVEAVERRAAGRPVAAVRVRAGTMLRIVEPSLQQAFALVAGGTVADGAAIEMTEVPAQLYCEECLHQVDTTDALAVCPECGGDRVRLTGGEDLVLESITLREGARRRVSGHPG